ncbi:MAG: hypothetical protein JRG94_19070, partial [Deltaproteobacteria bacterium]|nr:hypothetical protein [Deltaproteobacteria bacterium]
MLCLSAAAAVHAGGIGSRVFVVERASGSLAVYDIAERKLLAKRISDLGNLRHATMIFSPDLRYGYLATRNGQVSRINLETLERDGVVFTSENSIDNAISQDGRFIATAEYVPGGLTILDAESLEVLKKHPATFEVAGEQVRSRVTGVVDAPGNRFVCVLIEGAEIWIIDASKPGFPIEHRIKTRQGNPYEVRPRHGTRLDAARGWFSRGVAAGPQPQIRQRHTGEAPPPRVLGGRGQVDLRAAGGRGSPGRARPGQLGVR